MRKKITLTSILITAALMFVALAACGAAGQSMDNYARSETLAYDGDFAEEAPMEREAMADDGLIMNEAGETDLTTEQQSQQRIILRDASVQIVVEDTESTIGNISTMADEMGGWVVTSTTNISLRRDDQTYTNGNITVRVPAERLDEALQLIRDGAMEVESENVNGRDVTEEYVDLSSRLKNLEATEEQLAEILDSAYTVEDVLAVQRELSTTREQIEVIEGRLRYFDEAAAYSSIAVTVREYIPEVGNVQVAGWNPLNTAQNAFGSLIVVGQFLVDSVIVIAIMGIPALIVLTGVVWAIRRAWRALRVVDLW